MKINIKGPIVADSEVEYYKWYDMPHTSPSMVNSMLEEANGEDIELIVNSGGGSVFAGSEIYTSLREYEGNTVSKIVGVAASAASVIVMGTDRAMMSPTAQLMAHNSQTFTYGDHTEHDKTAEYLASVDRSIASAYQQKTGKPLEDVLALMERETWMTSEVALAEGFIDEVMFAEQASAMNEAPMLVNGLSKHAILKAQKEMSKIKTENKQEKKGLFANLNIFNTKKTETDMNKSDVQNAIKETLESPEFMEGLAGGITNAVNAAVSKQGDTVNQLVDHTNKVTETVNAIGETLNEIKAKLKMDGDNKNGKKLPSNMVELKVDAPVASTAPKKTDNEDSKVIDMSGFSQYFNSPQGITKEAVKKQQA